MSLSNLPSDLWTDLLWHWMDLKCVNAFDSAFTNKLNRSDILSIISHITIKKCLIDKINDFRLLAYVSLRDISITELEIRLCLDLSEEEEDFDLSGDNVINNNNKEYIMTQKKSKLQLVNGSIKGLTSLSFSDSSMLPIEIVDNLIEYILNNNMEMRN